MSLYARKSRAGPRSENIFDVAKDLKTAAPLLSHAAMRRSSQPQEIPYYAYTLEGEYGGSRTYVPLKPHLRPAPSRTYVPLHAPRRAPSQLHDRSKDSEFKPTLRRATAEGVNSATKTPTIHAPHKHRTMYTYTDYTRRLDSVAASPHTYFKGRDGGDSACPAMPRQDVT
jgi:hypothetical protein